MPDIAPDYTPTSQLSPETKLRKLEIMRQERADLDASIAVVEAELGLQGGEDPTMRRLAIR